MQGSINFDGTLSGSIAGGGGGGGSEVTITPTLQSGVKVADYSIDGVTGEIYVPEGGDIVIINPALNMGDKVADIEVNGVNKTLYSQSYAYANDLHDINSETVGGLQKGSNITPIKVKTVSYTDQAGADSETIGVLSVGDTDYSVKQKKVNILNYSTTEQETGVRWIDGKMLYRKVLVVDDLQADNISSALLSNVDYYYCGAMTVTQSNGQCWSPSIISMYNYQGAGTAYAILLKDSNNDLFIVNNSRQNALDVVAIVYYTKVVA